MLKHILPVLPCLLQVWPLPLMTIGSKLLQSFVYCAWCCGVSFCTSRQAICDWSDSKEAGFVRHAALHWTVVSHNCQELVS